MFVAGIVVALFTLIGRLIRSTWLIAYATLGMTAATLGNLQDNWSWLSLSMAMQSSISAGIMALGYVIAVLLGAWLTALRAAAFISSGLN